ncbi:MAG: hypothetical protein JNM27_21450 [Leptospirales bacterium]|nr:hypothetical protein [Leptospirales bacterium]
MKRLLFWSLAFALSGGALQAGPVLPGLYAIRGEQGVEEYLSIVQRQKDFGRQRVPVGSYSEETPSDADK